MERAVRIPLGPLVSLTALQEQLGVGNPEGDRYFWDCGCAARFDPAEGAWRYANACSDHATDAA